MWSQHSCCDWARWELHEGAWGNRLVVLPPKAATCGFWNKCIGGKRGSAGGLVTRLRCAVGVSAERDLGWNVWLAGSFFVPPSNKAWPQRASLFCTKVVGCMLEVRAASFSGKGGGRFEFSGVMKYRFATLDSTSNTSADRSVLATLVTFVCRTLRESSHSFVMYKVRARC